MCKQDNGPQPSFSSEYQKNFEDSPGNLTPVTLYNVNYISMKKRLILEYFYWEKGWLLDWFKKKICTFKVLQDSWSSLYKHDKTILS